MSLNIQDDDRYGKSRTLQGEMRTAPQVRSEEVCV